MIHKRSDIRGMTLIELMVAMAVSLLVLGLVVATLISQQKNKITQDQMMDMQQGVRAALEIMGTDLKMAGYNPLGTADATFLIANKAEISFQFDLNGDGDLINSGPPVMPDPSESIRYALTNDTNGDGVADSEPCHLGRALDGGGLQVLAENIEALNFVYFDRNGVVLPTPVANVTAISSIQVTIIAKSGTTVPVLFIRHRDNKTYSNRQGTEILPARNDDFRRIVLMHEFKCRNLQLN
jgi:type IV pilus assembly protein PilW